MPMSDYTVKVKPIDYLPTHTADGIAQTLSSKTQCPWCKKEIPPGAVSGVAAANNFKDFSMTCTECKRDIGVKVHTVPVFEVGKTERDIKTEELAKIMDELQKSKKKVADLEKKRAEIAEFLK